MIAELRKSIGALSEDEAKSWLFQFLLHISMAEEAKCEDERLAEQVKKIHEGFLQSQAIRDRQELQSLQKVHFVFGDSASGSLKCMLREKHRDVAEKVISFSDQFSVGPIRNLQETVGLLERQEWLANHINLDDEYIDSFMDDYEKIGQAIEKLPEAIPIWIWTGNNAHEQTGLRYLLYQLKEKGNEITVVNTADLYQEVTQRTNQKYVPLHTGELSPERLKAICEYSSSLRPVSKSERAALEKDWEVLSASKDKVRVWKNHKIHSVGLDYFDEFIIGTVRKLSKKNTFIKSARVIGEVIGHLEQYIGDGFFEYRLRQLSLNGLLEIKGVPKAMRYYSVRLR
ncbi:DUF1835 domain-containing protein [Bacillus sp. ISL-47]|uniref:DUF1835 domain-containing protein n=1 Tax=Bacillus sp. ISL-47 TaxID=2819130 RepID=UPI001BE57D15|nr:DUF1835 domain-containing protein [Bacillus sp. ISL-47]MBT2689673.1 DUF1835 domain-containing protein [Bacillus sp. ISL-47]MBT2709319.1 DUF1835 domain-containing protein [Pseudomonas sp. ISL-84]